MPLLGLPGITLEDSAIPTLNNSLRTLVRFGSSFTNLHCLVLGLVLLTSADTLPSHPGNPFAVNDRGEDQQWDHLFASNLLDATTLQPVMQSYLRLTEHCPEERKLVHGDFGSNNVLTDGKRLRVYWTGIALYGDPLFDVAGSFLVAVVGLHAYSVRVLSANAEKRSQLCCAPAGAISSVVDLKKSMKMLWQEIKNC